ncbi:MAG: hypothetical protein WCK31_00345 [bacterium]
MATTLFEGFSNEVPVFQEKDAPHSSEVIKELLIEKTGKCILQAKQEERYYTDQVSIPAIVKE